MIRGKRIALHAGKKIAGHFSPTSKRVLGAYMNVVQMAKRAGIDGKFLANEEGIIIGVDWWTDWMEKGSRLDGLHFNIEVKSDEYEGRHYLGEIMFSDIFTGCIIGTVEILPTFGYFDPSGDPVSKWAAEEQYQWMMRDIRFLPQPIPCSGKQGLWFVPWDIEEKIVKSIGG